MGSSSDERIPGEILTDLSRWVYFLSVYWVMIVRSNQLMFISACFNSSMYTLKFLTIFIYTVRKRCLFGARANFLPEIVRYSIN